MYCYDYNSLKAECAEERVMIHQLAEYIGISVNTLRRRMNSENDWFHEYASNCVDELSEAIASGEKQIRKKNGEMLTLKPR